jgi:hypothetical protein
MAQAKHVTSATRARITGASAKPSTKPARVAARLFACMAPCASRIDSLLISSPDMTGTVQLGTVLAWRIS